MRCFPKVLSNRTSELGLCAEALMHIYNCIYRHSILTAVLLVKRQRLVAQPIVSRNLVFMVPSIDVLLNSV